MVGFLLTRGMLVGIVAGILCFGFLKIFGEPSVDRAIAFEKQMDEAKDKAKADAAMAKGMPMPKEEAEPELVSRDTQSGIGLFIPVIVFGAAIGGLFALAFTLVYGRMANLDPRATSALLAAMGFIAVYAVPNLKYPANPPSVGEPETIGMRTAFYFAMIAISLAAVIASMMLRKRLIGRTGAWNASLIAGAIYLLAITVAAVALPGVNEVPDEFPAVVLWQFRIASFGAQLLMWTTIGLAFGALAQRVRPLQGQRVSSGRRS
jgi:predicted cobalt transporter CbtA